MLFMGTDQFRVCAHGRVQLYIYVMPLNMYVQTDANVLLECSGSVAMHGLFDGMEAWAYRGQKKEEVYSIQMIAR